MVKSDFKRRNSHVHLTICEFVGRQRLTTLSHVTMVAVT